MIDDNNYTNEKNDVDRDETSQRAIGCSNSHENINNNSSGENNVPMPCNILNNYNGDNVNGLLRRDQVVMHHALHYAPPYAAAAAARNTRIIDPLTGMIANNNNFISESIETTPVMTSLIPIGVQNHPSNYNSYIGQRMSIPTAQNLNLHNQICFQNEIPNFQSLQQGTTGSDSKNNSNNDNDQNEIASIMIGMKSNSISNTQEEEEQKQQQKSSNQPMDELKNHQTSSSVSNIHMDQNKAQSLSNNTNLGEEESSDQTVDEKIPQNNNMNQNKDSSKSNSQDLKSSSEAAVAKINTAPNKPEQQQQQQKQLLPQTQTRRSQRKSKPINYYQDRKEEKSITPWNERMEQLEEYVNKNGHCNVNKMINDENEKSLRRWLLSNRNRYKHNDLPEKRVHELSAFGFEFELQPDSDNNFGGDVVGIEDVINEPMLKTEKNRDSSSLSSSKNNSKFDKRWQTRLVELQSYKENNGHCNVKLKENNKLHYFVKNQRELYRKRMNGHETSLTEQRIQSLKSLDFDFTPNSKRGGGGRDEKIILEDIDHDRTITINEDQKITNMDIKTSDSVAGQRILGNRKCKKGKDDLHFTK